MSLSIPDGVIFAERNSYRTPKIMAHRGGKTLAPQNSLPAFEAVCRLGVWALESDIRLTRDGKPICMHDPVVETMTDGEGAIADLTFDELQKFRINRGVGADTLPADSLRIPTMDEYFDLCMKYGVVPFIELKTDDGIGPVMEGLRRRSMESFAVISSVDFPRLEEARRLSDKVFIHHIFSGEEYFDRLYDMGYAGLSFKVKSEDELPRGAATVGDVHERGLRICLRAADTPEAVRHMIDLGLDYQPSNKVFVI